MKENPTVVNDLREGQLLQILYYKFHEIDAFPGDSPLYPRTLTLLDLKSPLGYLSDSFRNSKLLRQQFKRQIPPELFQTLSSLIPKYHWAVTTEEMEEAGLLRYVDEGESD